MRDKGFANVHALTGGYDEWVKQGNATVKGKDPGDENPIQEQGSGIMLKTTITFAAVFAAAMLPHTETTVTWTGWFSDKGCAVSKVRSGNISPNGTECVKRCLRDGATPVFLSEQAKDMYEVKDHGGVLNDVGYHVEVTGVLDENAKTIAVRSVKRLSEVVQTCTLPKRTSKRP